MNRTDPTYCSFSPWGHIWYSSRILEWISKERRSLLLSSAKNKLNLQLSWAELVLFSPSPTSHPPRHPPTRDSLFLSLIWLILLQLNPYIEIGVISPSSAQPQVSWLSWVLSPAYPANPSILPRKVYFTSNIVQSSKLAQLWPNPNIG